MASERKKFWGSQKSLPHVAENLSKLVKPLKINLPQPHNWREQRRDLFVNKHISKFTRSFRANFLTLLISSLGLVVALSWNNFWTAWISTLTVENTIFYKFVIAVLMTMLAVVLTYIFSMFKGEK